MGAQFDSNKQPVNYISQARRCDARLVDLNASRHFAPMRRESETDPIERWLRETNETQPFAPDLPTAANDIASYRRATSALAEYTADAKAVRGAIATVSGRRRTDNEATRVQRNRLREP